MPYELKTCVAASKKVGPEGAHPVTLKSLVEESQHRAADDSDEVTSCMFATKHITQKMIVTANVR